MKKRTTPQPKCKCDKSKLLLPGQGEIDAFSRQYGWIVRNVTFKLICGTCGGSVDSVVVSENEMVKY